MTRQPQRGADDQDPLGHEIVRTAGGSWAVRSVGAGEVMHPGVGPLVEARQLYVCQSRLAARLVERGGQPVPGAAVGADASVVSPASELVLFDVGLGAGSNALAAFAESEAAPSSAARLHLVSFERDLGALKLALAHGADFGFQGAAICAAEDLLACGVHETQRTSWRLENGDVLAALARQTVRADIVFWDPFSPRTNPGLWTVAAFSAMRAVTSPHGTLFTYSASTAVRVALLLAGFAVGAGDATGDKAQTTAAAVCAADLARPLARSWLARLSRPDVPLPADAPTDAALRVAMAPQFRPC